MPPGATLAPPACLAAGTWDCEDWGNNFTDQSGVTPNLWRNVGTLQHYSVSAATPPATAPRAGWPRPATARPTR